MILILKYRCTYVTATLLSGVHGKYSLTMDRYASGIYCQTDVYYSYNKSEKKLQIIAFSTM